MHLIKLRCRVQIILASCVWTLSRYGSLDSGLRRLRDLDRSEEPPPSFKKRYCLQIQIRNIVNSGEHKQAAEALLGPVFQAAA